VVDSKRIRGKFPLGVDFSIRSKKFRSRCRQGGSVNHLGYFNDEKLAHREWQKFKVKVIASHISKQSDKRLINAPDRMAKKIQLDYDLNIKTTYY